jgi:hypothetical protein
MCYIVAMLLRQMYARVLKPQASIVVIINIQKACLELQLEFSAVSQGKGKN